MQVATVDIMIAERLKGVATYGETITATATVYNAK